MNSFTKKNITHANSPGGKLKEARMGLGVSVEQAARNINLSPKYIEAMEDGRWQDLPGRVYVKNFLKSYCKYLHIGFQDIWSVVSELECGEGIKCKDIDQKHLTKWPKRVKIALCVLVVVAVLSFLFYEVERVFAPPKLEIIEPTQELVTNQKQVNIIGQSEKEVEIVINNSNVLVDSTGRFETMIDLQKGYNLIKITASKRYGRVQEEEIRILFNQEDN
jgi:cytoskeletal protein RodZ